MNKDRLIPVPLQQLDLSFLKYVDYKSIVAVAGRWI